jgi:hypothetical protein
MGKIKTLLCSLCLLFIGLTAGYASTLDDSQKSLADGKEQLREAVAITYTSQIGVKETLGKNDSHQIRAYLKVTGFDQPVAWCAAFVSYCFTENGIDNPKSAWSPSWFPPDRVIYSKGQPLKIKPLKADVFGVYYANMKRIAHVGFVDSWPQGDYAITVEGNTNDNGSREGDGVYRKRRLKANIYRVSRWI